MGAENIQMSRETSRKAAATWIALGITSFEDWLAFTRAPPLVYGNVTFEVGGNLYTEFTDTQPGELAIGMPVRFAFRVKDFDSTRAFRRYAWKATPARN